MGSLYFLAPSDAEALRFVGHAEDLLGTDHVLAHDMITVPHLTALPDLAQGLPISIDLSMTKHLWPHMPENPHSDLAWMAEPIIERIADALRDRVAAIRTDQVAALTEDWSAELRGSVDRDACGQLATDLILLARRGRDHRLGLYNWYEL